MSQKKFWLLRAMGLLVVLALLIPLAACKADESVKMSAKDLAEMPLRAVSANGTDREATQPATATAATLPPATVPTPPPTSAATSAVELLTIPEDLWNAELAEGGEWQETEEVGWMTEPEPGQLEVQPAEAAEAEQTTEAAAVTEAPATSAAEATPAPPYNQPGVTVLNSATAMKEDFSAWLAEQGVPVVIDYSATWCGPCQQAAPVIHELASAQDGKLVVVNIDVDQAGLNPNLSAFVQNIQSVPTFELYVNGVKTNTKTGYQGPEELKSFCLSGF